jgi:hypothetical protein
VVLTDVAPAAGEGPVGVAGAAAPAAPAWLIVNVRPATVRMPVRGEVDVLAATVAITVPVPAPLAGATATQDTFEAAVHVQPLAVLTVTCVPPPAAGGAADVPDNA